MKGMDYQLSTNIQENEVCHVRFVHVIAGF